MLAVSQSAASARACVHLEQISRYRSHEHTSKLCTAVAGDSRWTEISSRKVRRHSLLAWREASGHVPGNCNRPGCLAEQLPDDSVLLHLGRDEIPNGEDHDREVLLEDPVALHSRHHGQEENNEVGEEQVVKDIPNPGHKKKGHQHHNDVHLGFLLFHGLDSSAEAQE